MRLLHGGRAAAVLPCGGARQDDSQLSVDTAFDAVAEPVHHVLGTGVQRRRGDVLKGTPAKDVALHLPQAPLRAAEKLSAASISETKQIVDEEGAQDEQERQQPRRRVGLGRGPAHAVCASPKPQK